MNRLGNYELRKARPGETNSIWNLISSVLRSYGIVADRETTDQDLVDLEASFGADRGAFFVLVHEGAIVGTVALRIHPGRRVELCRMYILESHRGKGLGRMLLEHALAEARALGMQTVFLKTASVLKEAIALYRKSGFVPVEGAAACGNCDIMMEKPLAEKAE
jgi:putative acetyltransferase